jgi:hypothetical protein
MHFDTHLRLPTLGHQLGQTPSLRRKRVRYQLKECSHPGVMIFILFLLLIILILILMIWIFVGNLCDSTTSEMRSLSPKIISGDSR